jgi:hypothetical protein
MEKCIAEFPDNEVGCTLLGGPPRAFAELPSERDDSGSPPGFGVEIFFYRYSVLICSYQDEF